MTQICVTKEDVELAERLIEEFGGQERAYCCPNAIAVCRAFGIDVIENISTEDVAVSFDGIHVRLDASVAAELPKAARDIVAWFDLRHRPEPEWPACFELDIAR